jgi:hypothetical protein
MPEDKIPLDIVTEYFRALRSEIIEAQKLRVQVGLAKIVFLGSLLGFFLREAKDTDNAAILICPFVALMFDFMVYGLSFNIRDVGGTSGITSKKRGWNEALRRTPFLALGFGKRIAPRGRSPGIAIGGEACSGPEAMACPY